MNNADKKIGEELIRLGTALRLGATSLRKMDQVDKLLLHTSLKVPLTSDLEPKIIGMETNHEAFHSEYDLSYTMREVVDVKIELARKIDREAYPYEIRYTPRKRLL